MSVQTKCRRRRALIATFACLAVIPLTSCFGTDSGVETIDPEEGEAGRFTVNLQIRNVRTVYADNGAFVRGGHAYLTIPRLLEDPPCCIVFEGQTRQRDMGVTTGEAWFIRAYAGGPGFTVDVTRWEQNRCRVTATEPTGFQPKPVLIVTYDNAGADHLVCSGGWENF